MDQKIRMGVLHGAIRNAGDFFIYESGKKLLENFLGSDFDFTYKLRTEQINGNFDGLIILGGPLISRKIHPQSKNIFKYIKKRDIPVFCFGLGISGEKFSSDENYFLDLGSIKFWKHVYEKTKLLSVRDKITYLLMRKLAIKAELTGDPALFNLETLEENKVDKEKNMNFYKINKIAVTIPNLSLSIYSLKDFLLTTYFLFLLKMKFNKKDIGLFFQHGYSNLPTRIMKKLANMIGIKTYDLSGKSLDSSPEFYKYDVHIGTRLHSHIYFLTLNKPSFLLSVDNRTGAFLKTIKTPAENYANSGIKNLVNMLKRKIEENNFNEFDKVSDEISKLYAVMKNFLNKIVLFYSKKGEAL